MIDAVTVKAVGNSLSHRVARLETDMQYVLSAVAKQSEAINKFDADLKANSADTADIAAMLRNGKTFMGMLAKHGPRIVAYVFGVASAFGLIDGSIAAKIAALH